MTPRTVAVVSAGLSQPSSTRLLADRLAAATQRALQRTGVSVDLQPIELRDRAHDLTNNLLTGFAPAPLRAALEQVAAADALIAVTPIFSASYSGLFKTFFDVLEPNALSGKPVLLGATAGTARHSLALDHALRPLFAYLRALPVPTAVFAASEDWGSAGGTHNSALSERIDRAAGELARLVPGVDARRPADPFDEPVPFEQLLTNG